MSRIAVDFDGTLWDRHGSDHKVIEPVAERVRAAHRLGDEIIIWTSRPDYTTPEIRAILDANDIPYDFVLGGKLFYDELWDDKAIPPWGSK